MKADKIKNRLKQSNPIGVDQPKTDKKGWLGPIAVKPFSPILWAKRRGNIHANVYHKSLLSGLVECDRISIESISHSGIQRPLAARHVQGDCTLKTFSSAHHQQSPWTAQEYSGIYFSQPSPLRYDPYGAKGVD